MLPTFLAFLASIHDPFKLYYYKILKKSILEKNEAKLWLGYFNLTLEC